MDAGPVNDSEGALWQEQEDRGLAAWRQRPVRISTAPSRQGLHLHVLVSWSRAASPSIRGRGNGLTDQPAAQNRITCEDLLMDNISRVRLTDGLEYEC